MRRDERAHEYVSDPGQPVPSSRADRHERRPEWKPWLIPDQSLSRTPRCRQLKSAPPRSGSHHGSAEVELFVRLRHGQRLGREADRQSIPTIVPEGAAGLEAVDAVMSCRSASRSFAASYLKSFARPAGAQGPKVEHYVEAPDVDHVFLPGHGQVRCSRPCSAYDRQSADDIDTSCMPSLVTIRRRRRGVFGGKTDAVVLPWCLTGRTKLRFSPCRLNRIN